MLYILYFNSSGYWFVQIVQISSFVTKISCVKKVFLKAPSRVLKLENNFQCYRNEAVG